jgi:hypothetical protein
LHKLWAANILGRGSDARQAPDILAGHHELGQQHVKDERFGHAVGHGMARKNSPGLVSNVRMVAHRPGKKAMAGEILEGHGRTR